MSFVAHEFEMPSDVGITSSYGTTGVINKSLRLYSADWTGVLDVEVQYKREAFHALYHAVFSGGGSVVYDLPHEYTRVRVNVTTDTSGSIPSATLTGRTP
jgi:hypothetical protein